jgi:hypothetical protein
MVKFKNYIFLLFLGLLFSLNANAQIDKTFWFAVPHLSPKGNWNTTANSFFRIGTFDKTATVTISQPAAGGAVLAIQTINANSNVSINLTSAMIAIGDDAILNKGILISSTELISVYFDSGVGDVNPDLFALKGSNALGNDFIITSGNFQTFYDSRHEAYILATEDNTTVNITPKVNVLNHNAGVTFSKVLNKGQVYILSSLSYCDTAVCPRPGAATHSGMNPPEPPNIPYVDSTSKLGGTLIESDKPISVVHSDDLVMVPNGNCADLNGDQLIPTRLAGKEYLIMPGSLNQSGGTQPLSSYSNYSDYTFIYPIKNGVQISVNGNLVATKNRGEFYLLNNDGTPKYITSSDSVLLYQITGNACEVGGAVIPALTCTGSQSVGIVRNNTLDFKLSILTKQADIGSFTFRKSTGVVTGVILSSAFSAVGSGGWYAASIDLNISNPILNGEGAIISNSTGLFHLGVTSNTGGGTSFGYFSNFGTASGEILNTGTTVCENGKAELTATIPGGVSSYQWSRNGVVLPQFTGDSVITCRPGNYKLVASTSTGCPATIEYPLNFSRCRYACVENLKVSLNGKCQYTLGLTEAVLPSDCLEAPDYFLVVNDANPSNGAVIDGISPASGWTYGVFLNLDNGGTELICQGRVVVTDDLGPIFTPEQKAAWETIDTVVTWADNVDEVVNNPLTWWGNSSGYQLPPTFSGANKYYMGRPYMTDSCEINNCGALGSQGTWLIDKDSSGTASLRDSFSLHRSCNLQYRVTDYLETPQCDSTGFQHKLRRSFEITDQRGNRTVLNQIIYFKRPDLRKTNTDRFAREFALVTEPLDRGPGNLGQFGPFGNGPRKVHAHYGEADNLPAGGLINFRDKLGADQMSSTNYSLYADTISYNTSLGSCGSFDAQTELKPLLTSIYVAVDSLPGGRKDSISLFSERLASNYSVSYTYKEFPICNQGKSYEVVTTVNDWCTGLMEVDTLIIKILDQSAPVFEPYYTGAQEGIIRGRTPGDSIVVPIGVSDCSASLRLPSKIGTRTNLRDLSSLFNWGVYDKCSGGNTTTDRNGTGVTLNYKFESRDVWNDRFFKDRGNYESVNYTLTEMNGGLVALGIPIGEHRLIIEAWDGCNNEKKDTLYFDVQDKTAPVMICKDQVNVSLTSNSTSNYYLKNNGESDRELLKDQNVRVWVNDVNKGSRDNCTLDSMYIRRRIDWATCSPYLVWNMDYDVFGNNNGEVDINDFEAIAGSTLRYTPKYMQYVEVFCCDGASGTQVMYELWGSDLVQGILGNSDNNAPAGRSWSYCWGNIQVEDKTAPVITAPNLNKSYNARAKNWIGCTEKEGIGTSSHTDGLIADEIRSNALFGSPDIYGLECKGEVKYLVTKALFCDTGIITRKWVVTKETGDGITLKDSATQTIYVRANHNFSITVPEDQSATCSSKAGTDVILDETGCDLLAVSYSERKYDAAPGDPFCYKVYRTATVINWCMVPNYFTCSTADPGAYAVRIPRNTGTSAVKYTFTLSPASTERIQDASSARTGGSGVLVKGGAIASAGESLIAGGTTTSGFSSPATNTCYTKPGFAYQYTQVIKVTDNVKPIVASGTDWTPATSETDVKGGILWNKTKNSFSISGKLANPSCVAKIKLSFAASDVCATNDLELEKTEILRRGTDVAATGTVVTGTALTTTNGLFTVELSGVPVGEYDLRVTVRDDCGNVTVSRLAVDVEDNKAPAPVCVQNLTATLMPDGTGGCMVVVKAIDVFQDINRNWDTEECSPSVVATIAKLTNGVEGAKAETLTLTGADKDGIVARVYLTDAAGNENYCTVNIFLEDNVCQPAASATIAGAIQTESKVTVEGVQVNLSGQSQKNFATGVNGNYVFSNLTKGMDYTVTPSLNKGFLNGVSTYDLILISKHILGNQPLNTPYKLIAADVNNSKSITTLDMIQLRKLILNIEPSFPSNQSWRFVDASYTFPNPSNPWVSIFPEVKNLNDLTGSMSANFVAIKVGDVNGNAIANSTQGSIRNLTANLGIEVPDMNMVAGNEYKVDFTAADLNGVEGFQFTLNLDKKGLDLVDIVPGIAGEEHFGIFTEEGVVTASWNGESKGGVLFSLVVRAKTNTTLSEVLNLNSRYTAAEAYKGGEVMNVGINFNASKSSANYALYQNTPNPFAGETVIGFNLPVAGEATLTIQDVTGRTLKVINGQYAKGYNQVNLKSNELTATGVLTYTLKAADYTLTKKMIVVE